MTFQLDLSFFNFIMIIIIIIIVIIIIIIIIIIVIAIILQIVAKCKLSWPNVNHTTFAWSLGYQESE